jgi:ribonuclease R
VTFLKCEFLSHRLGEQYTGVITAVTNFGMFIELEDLYIEGLVHITELGEDYFHYDGVRHVLKGERTGQAYRLGDRVEVQVAQVVLDTRKVDFRLLKHLSSQEPIEADTPSADEDAAPKKKRRSRNFRKKNKSRKAKDTA